MGTPKRILIIDDEPNILELTAIRLASEGYETATAQNYEEAFNSIGEKVPDLILMDVMMPDKDGYTLCNEIKCRGKTRNTPIILFTAKAEQRERLKANAGFLAADDYILKPFEPEDLLLKIRKLIG
jgi:DNA-binding response OmpR family regulator